ncbi:MAG: efflux RND transporter periplasmic adaptor subunit [Bacteroidales bacterium]|nr:efflux RND transporter periplasmic adaptor subunit [Bacteroidales bacterium]
MKAKILLLGAGALLLTLASCDKKKKTTGETETMTVDVAEATVDSVLISKTYPGTITARNSVDVVGRVSGTLTSQRFEDGDHVRKGQVLFTIEDTEYRDAVQQAEAALANSESAYEYAQRNYEALKKALESDAVSQMQVIEAKSSMEQAEADIKNAKAALQNARTNLGYCTVTAPFDGDMTRGYLAPGAYVAGAASPIALATIYDNSTFWANFYIEDAAYEKSFLNPDRHLIDFDHVPVDFTEELPHKYEGPLSYTAPSIDSSTGTLMLRIGLQSPYKELRNGMYCSVNLPYKVDPHAVLVKDASISTSQTNKYLYVVNDSNKVVYTPIEVGDMANDSMRIVTKGLKGGEKYVTKALLKVRPGMTVKPVLTK